MGVDNINENVDTLASLAERAERNVSSHQRRIERFTAQLGRPRSIYVIAAFAALWTAVNALGPYLGVRPLDPPPFAWLQGVISFSALLMTTIVLTTQNRQSRHADQRAQLELQVNLLAEQKIAKIISLLEELRRDMPTVRDRVDEVAEIMKEPVDPHAVLSALEQTMDPKEPLPEEPEEPRPSRAEEDLPRPT